MTQNVNYALTLILHDAHNIVFVLFFNLKSRFIRQVEEHFRNIIGTVNYTAENKSLLFCLEVRLRRPVTKCWSICTIRYNCTLLFWDLLTTYNDWYVALLHLFQLYTFASVQVYTRTIYKVLSIGIDLSPDAVETPTFECVWWVYQQLYQTRIQVMYPATFRRCRHVGLYRNNANLMHGISG